LVVEGHGHPLNFVISRGHHHDQRYILETIDGIRIGQRKRKPKRLGLDKGYDSEPLRQALRHRRIIPIVPYRKNHVTVPRGRPPKDRVQGCYTRQRWKIERSFAWANRFRRLDRLLEHGQKTYRAFVRAFFVKYYLDLLY
jgi:transposase